MAPRISRHRLALRGSGVLFCRVKHAGTSPGKQDAGDVNGTNHDEPPHVLPGEQLDEQPGDG